MTIGTGTYPQGGQFAFPRSYISGLTVFTAGFLLVQTGNRFTLDFRPVYPSIYYWTFDLAFFVWNTNCYTLDHLVTECYYKDFPTDSEHALDFGVRWSRVAAPHHPVIEFAANSNFTTPEIATFPPPIPGYWTDPT